MTQKEAESKGLEEYGVVTGRRRRIGYFDMELAKRNHAESTEQPKSL